MNKIADIVAFLFLGTLSLGTGLVIITAQAQLNSTTEFIAAPSNLVAQQSEFGRIYLSWSDSSYNEEHFNIQRRTEIEPYTTIGGTSANVTYFVDMQISPGTRYAYRVYARNSVTRSEYSNEVSVQSSTSSSGSLPGTSDGTFSSATTTSSDNTSESTSSPSLSNTNTNTSSGTSDTNQNTASHTSSDTTTTSDIGSTQDTATQSSTNTNSTSNTSWTTNTNTSGDSILNSNSTSGGASGTGEGSVSANTNTTSVQAPITEPAPSGGTAGSPTAEPLRNENTTAAEPRLPISAPLAPERLDIITSVEGDLNMSDYYEKQCAELGITNSIECQKLIALDLDPECRTAGIMIPSQCNDFLKSRHLDSYCLERNIEAASCAQYLIDQHRTELRCGTLADAACEALSRTQFIGQIASGIRAREALTNAIESQHITHITIRDLATTLQAERLTNLAVPVRDDSTETFLLLPAATAINVSTPAKAAVTLPYLITSDTDGDRLPNDLEKLYGTDPKSKDTDGDGYADGDEIKNGYDPLLAGGAKNEPTFQTTESALIYAAALEEPATNGTVDDAFTITPIPAPVIADTQKVSLSGKALPNSIILIYVYSDLPMVLTVKTDEFGNWQYDLQENLIDGRHTVYIAVTDNTGKITRKSKPLSFFVRSARAVTVSNFLKDEPLPTPQPETSFIKYYLIGGFVLVAAALFAVLLIVRRRMNVHA